MDEATVDQSSKAKDDHNIKEITVYLRINEQGTHKLFFFKSSVLIAKSEFFANKLSSPNASSCIEIHCSVLDYDHYVHLLSHLHLPSNSLVDSWKSVNSALGVLKVAVSLQCEEIAKACVDYLEAVPWEDKEEEEIIRIVPQLGNIASPILARVKPLDPNLTKNVFLAAVRYAMSINPPCPPFGDEIRISAQEQIEYMLVEDEETPLVAADDQVKSEIKNGLSQMFSLFEKELSSLLSYSDISLETSENNLLHNLGGLEWLCNLLPKINLMGDFVSKWVDLSIFIISVIENPKLESVMWSLKFKLIEITAKVLDIVGYGNVILPPVCRVQLLKIWLPYIQKMKPILDSVGDKTGFPFRMDEDLCQSIQGAIVSLIVALPSNDQADILANWMESKQLEYPDLTEAFEIWCYRTKSSNRRLAEGLDGLSNGSFSSNSSS
ncbi:BTB/POZ domain-containing protein At3g05675-like [Amaranthus tricolor]|uniref:BTB/POZ domain-containing protein At3g05675-like n=1 Tax=Amaranthus tricolor TaxID=29722 RepID=UPI00258F5510|nr:BTB/POZ domain-containing protein At3g05675-like [Amaranthus tricolor]